jgi:hypothetical protein
MPAGSRSVTRVALVVTSARQDKTMCAARAQHSSCPFCAARLTTGIRRLMPVVTANRRRVAHSTHPFMHPCFDPCQEHATHFLKRRSRHPNACINVAVKSARAAGDAGSLGIDCMRWTRGRGTSLADDGRHQCAMWEGSTRLEGGSGVVAGSFRVVGGSSIDQSRETAAGEIG